MKDFLWSWIGTISVATVAIPPKPIYRFEALSVKILMTSITEMGKKPQIHKEPQNHKGPQNWVKVILNMNNNAGGITVSDFKPYYRNTVKKKKKKSKSMVMGM